MKSLRMVAFAVIGFAIMFVRSASAQMIQYPSEPASPGYHWASVPAYEVIRTCYGYQTPFAGETLRQVPNGSPIGWVFVGNHDGFDWHPGCPAYPFPTA